MADVTTLEKQAAEVAELANQVASAVDCVCTDEVEAAVASVEAACVQAQTRLAMATCRVRRAVRNLHEALAAEAAGLAVTLVRPGELDDYDGLAAALALVELATPERNGA